MMEAVGTYSKKEIAAEVGISHDHLRQLLAPNGIHRNEKILAAVREIREGLARNLKGIGEIIAKRLKAEIEHGDSEFAHKYIAQAREFMKDMEPREERAAGDGGTKIAALIQNVYKR